MKGTNKDDLKIEMNSHQEMRNFPNVPSPVINPLIQYPLKKVISPKKNTKINTIATQNLQQFMQKMINEPVKTATAAAIVFDKQLIKDTLINNNSQTGLLKQKTIEKKKSTILHKNSPLHNDALSQFPSFSPKYSERYIRSFDQKIQNINQLQQQQKQNESNNIQNISSKQSVSTITSNYPKSNNIHNNSSTVDSQFISQNLSALQQDQQHQQNNNMIRQNQQKKINKQGVSQSISKDNTNPNNINNNNEFDRNLSKQQNHQSSQKDQNPKENNQNKLLFTQLQKSEIQQQVLLKQIDLGTKSSTASTFDGRKNSHYLNSISNNNEFNESSKINSNYIFNSQQIHQNHQNISGNIESTTQNNYINKNQLSNPSQLKLLTESMDDDQLIQTTNHTTIIGTIQNIVIKQNSQNQLSTGMYSSGMEQLSSNLNQQGQKNLQNILISDDMPDHQSQQKLEQNKIVKKQEGEEKEIDDLDQINNIKKWKGLKKNNQTNTVLFEAQTTSPSFSNFMYKSSDCSPKSSFGNTTNISKNKKNSLGFHLHRHHHSSAFSSSGAPEDQTLTNQLFLSNISKYQKVHSSYKQSLNSSYRKSLNSISGHYKTHSNNFYDNNQFNLEYQSNQQQNYGLNNNKNNNNTTHFKTEQEDNEEIKQSNEDNNNNNSNENKQTQNDNENKLGNSTKKNYGKQNLSNLLMSINMEHLVGSKNKWNKIYKIFSESKDYMLQSKKSIPTKSKNVLYQYQQNRKYQPSNTSATLYTQYLNKFTDNNSTNSNNNNNNLTLQPNHMKQFNNHTTLQNNNITSQYINTNIQSINYNNKQRSSYSNHQSNHSLDTIHHQNNQVQKRQTTLSDSKKMSNVSLNQMMNKNINSQSFLNQQNKGFLIKNMNQNNQFSQSPEKIKNNNSIQYQTSLNKKYKNEGDKKNEKNNNNQQLNSSLSMNRQQSQKVGMNQMNAITSSTSFLNSGNPSSNVLSTAAVGGENQTTFITYRDRLKANDQYSSSTITKNLIDKKKIDEDPETAEQKIKLSKYFMDENIPILEKRNNFKEIQAMFMPENKKFNEQTCREMFSFLNNMKNFFLKIENVPFSINQLNLMKANEIKSSFSKSKQNKLQQQQSQNTSPTEFGSQRFISIVQNQDDQMDFQSYVNRNSIFKMPDLISNKNQKNVSQIDQQ